MLRNQRLIVVLFIVLLGLTAPAVFAQPGVVASFTGTISSPAQEDRITFEVDTDQIKLNPGGSVDLVFLLSRESSAGSARRRPSAQGMVNTCKTYMRYY